MGTSEAGGPDDEGEEQRILALSPGEGVEGEGADQQEPAQSQHQSEEESQLERRGHGTSYRQARRAVYLPLVWESAGRRSAGRRWTAIAVEYDLTQRIETSHTLVITTGLSPM